MSTRPLPPTMGAAQNAAVRLASTLLAAGAVVLLGATPASADCASDGFAPEGMPVVFSGTVVDERGSYAKFEVDQVWAGPDLAAEVWVQGGQDQEPWPFNLLTQVSSSIDVEFTPGEEYVVGAQEDFSTNACQVADIEERPAPAQAREPVADGAQGADVPMNPYLQTALGAAALAGIVTAGVRWRRRRKAVRSGQPTPT